MLQIANLYRDARAVSRTFVQLHAHQVVRVGHALLAFQNCCLACVKQQGVTVSEEQPNELWRAACLDCFWRLASGFCLAFAPSWLSVAPIASTVNVNVHQLCDDAGSNCASTGPTDNAFFADSTNKIWSQAGISVTFTFG